MVDMQEGYPPEFNCMNEHYGMSFVKDGRAEIDIATGKLTSEKASKHIKVVRWSTVGCLITWYPQVLVLPPRQGFV